MTLTKENFKYEVEESRGVVLVDFYAPWCGPCKIMAPVIDELIKEYQNNNNVKIGKLNVEENQQIAEKYNILGVPTLIIFKDGKIAEQAVGLRLKDDLKILIEKNI